LKEKYQALLKSSKVIYFQINLKDIDNSDANEYSDEEENLHYQEDFEPVDIEHKKNKNHHHLEEDDDDGDLSRFTNELPNEGEDTLPNIPTVDAHDSSNFCMLINLQRC
jgi:hypothetical protein